MLSLLLLSLRWLLVSASSGDDADGVVVEDEPTKSGLPFPGGKMPSADELLRMLDSMTGLSDEEKATLREDLLKQQGSAAAAAAASNPLTMQMLMLLGMLSLIGLVFGNCPRADPASCQRGCG